MEMTRAGKRNGRRPKKRWMDLMKEEKEMVGAREGDEIDRAL